jgi:hypothetical protein
MESLGPKPTAKQMETLKKLCEEGVEIHWWSGLRSPDHASIVWKDAAGASFGSERFRTDTLYKFRTWGWIEAIGDPAWAWRNNEYRITENGRKVAEMGAIRKSRTP